MEKVELDNRIQRLYEGFFSSREVAEQIVNDSFDARLRDCLDPELYYVKPECQLVFDNLAEEKSALDSNCTLGEIISSINLDITMGELAARILLCMQHPAIGYEEVGFHLMRLFLLPYLEMFVSLHVNNKA